VPQDLIVLAYDCILDATLPDGTITSGEQHCLCDPQRSLTGYVEMADNRKSIEMTIIAWVHGISVEVEHRAADQVNPGMDIYHLDVHGETVAGGLFNVVIGVPVAVVKELVGKIL
jgi:hypothetical protein